MGIKNKILSTLYGIFPIVLTLAFSSPAAADEADFPWPEVCFTVRQ
ncbi:hypothetical protein dsmv_2260 [Desulfococcus multivorans DSM 2059]|jgi:hypothetical protein|uniref:Uncharacterized protein n=1 Tax=Desulfococcus multivorans DSM 2059 TaxID=1121405 RepID=S7TWK6_DESML|nr:hypothetical protein dsmv_2260 [Desulfococcus multivorans DSM 2059]SJZ59681.1 hypothetical protein SAMN02745446_01058 [Desulfococcus multivorans DSM 2059]